jgi:hypothetical protein
MICMIVFFVNFLVYDGKVKKKRKGKRPNGMAKNCRKECVRKGN